MHPRLPERELKFGASLSDTPKTRTGEDGNLSRQNDYLTFKLDRICQTVRHMFEKGTKENNYLIAF